LLDKAVSWQDISVLQKDLNKCIVIVMLIPFEVSLTRISHLVGDNMISRHGEKFLNTRLKISTPLSNALAIKAPDVKI